MAGIYYIVAKLKQASGGAELVVTDQMEVATKVEEATDRIGVRAEDIVAVWSFPRRLNPEEAREYVKAVEPESMWVLLGGWPFELDRRYLETVRGTGGRV
jgi:hypothetical protein